MNVQPLETPLATSPLLQNIGGLDDALTLGLGSQGAAAGDAISRFVQPGTPQPMGSTPATPGFASEYNPVDSMLAQLMQMMQMMMSALGLGGIGGMGGFPGYGGGGGGGFPTPYPGPSGYGCPYGGEQFYPNATGGSQGDPHLSFNGNTWNNMTSQPNLLNSNSIPGGFQISTQVTPPGANGVTYNQCATIALNGGATTVSMNGQGQSTIQEYGQTIPLSPGQSMTLGNGESVTCNQSGSLTVLASNGQGGQISTTLTRQGPGVNVGVTAQNVDLGGTLVNGNQLIPEATLPQQPQI